MQAEPLVHQDCLAYALRARVLHFVDSPNAAGDQAWEYWPDGLLHVVDGKIAEVGNAEDLLPQLPQDTLVKALPNHLVLPGFVDTHVHYPQLNMMGAYGEQLLEWLSTYTFPNEMRFDDYEYASAISQQFLTELLRNGTTTALVFATVHSCSVDAFFSAAESLNLRMICGKVLMDRNCPEKLQDGAETGILESKKLIDKWHKHGRLQYAITPRFAPTSSKKQLENAGRLLQEYPDVYVHSHLAENKDEISWVKELFPECDNYLDVYDRAGLLGRRSVFAHGVHLCESECVRLSNTQSVVAHCPSSNLFLGSGLFAMDALEKHNIKIGLGSDVGAGTTLSMFGTMSDAYKVQQLRGAKLNPMQSYYLATLGGARALDIDSVIGNFNTGKEADFQIIDLAATDLIKHRMQNSFNLQDTLFALSILGDDRLIQYCFSAGKCVYERDGKLQ